MVFDRTAISSGRTIQDFGLCDLKGVYQHTSRMRSKGFLAIAFIDSASPASIDIITALADWTSIGPKVAGVVVAMGERADAESLASTTQTTLPILWDAENYLAPIWAITAVPTIFVVNDKGIVLGRVRGTDSAELLSAKEMIAEEVRKSDEAAAAAAAAKAAADAAKASAEPAKK
jgi:hypothetical protein